MGRTFRSYFVGFGLSILLAPLRAIKATGSTFVPNNQPNKRVQNASAAAAVGAALRVLATQPPVAATP